MLKKHQILYNFKKYKKIPIPLPLYSQFSKKLGKFFTDLNKKIF